jgi:hypothetical protein
MAGLCYDAPSVKARPFLVEMPDTPLCALSEDFYQEKFPSCKFFGDETGQIMKTHARVDFSHVRQADTQEGSRWHASVSPWKTTMAARSRGTRTIDVKAAKDSWLLGKTAKNHPNTNSFRTSLTSLASLAEVTD